MEVMSDVNENFPLLKRNFFSTTHALGISICSISSNSIDLVTSNANSTDVPSLGPASFPSLLAYLIVILLFA
jgi:Cft2 family RNA processing exonuclease